LKLVNEIILYYEARSKKTSNYKYALSRYFIEVHEKWELRNDIRHNR